jgi:hypothetical protein
MLEISVSLHFSILMNCVNSMREFTPPSFPVYMYDVDGNYTVKTIGEVSGNSDIDMAVPLVSQLRL